MDEQPTYVTAAGLQKLEAEYKELKEVTIPAMAVRIDDAKQLGDLSENADYQEAKDEMVWLQSKLAELEDKLRKVKVIDESGGGDIVSIGSTITVQSGENERVLTIVGASEADPAQGKISNESPLGAAFLDRNIGDEVEVDTPGGKKTYTIKSIS